jgi:hypothetical protein
MTAGSDSRRAIAGAIVGLLYGSTLALWSLVLFRGGHATSVPLFLSSAPLGILALVGKLVGEPYVSYGYRAALLGAPLVWAALGSLVTLRGRGSTLTHSSFASVALRVRARAPLDERRRALPFCV